VKARIAASEALTDVQRTQEQLIRQERLRALGQMASGIVHDLNNALGTVLGYSELLLERLGRGTTVTVRLPGHATSEPRDSSSTDLHDTSSGLRVLVVDDEPGIRRILREYLVGNGHTVEAAFGEDAGHHADRFWRAHAGRG
jgi:signal transduction histidine kinase